jgi:hypothetical protein
MAGGAERVLRNAQYIRMTFLYMETDLALLLTVALTGPGLSLNAVFPCISV